MAKNKKITIPLSEEDIRDFQMGRKAEWTFPTEKGELIDVCLYNEEFEN